MLQNAASDQGLHGLRTEMSMENTVKMKTPPKFPKTRNGLIQMMSTDRFTGHKRVKLYELNSSFLFSVSTEPAVRNSIEVIYQYPALTKDCVPVHDNNIDTYRPLMNQKLSRVCENPDGSYMQWEIVDYTSVEFDADTVS